MHKKTCLEAHKAEIFRYEYLQGLLQLVESMSAWYLMEVNFLCG